jgi:hypothetical protein
MWRQSVRQRLQDAFASYRELAARRRMPEEDLLLRADMACRVSELLSEARRAGGLESLVEEVKTWISNRKAAFSNDSRIGRRFPPSQRMPGLYYVHYHRYLHKSWEW